MELRNEMAKYNHQAGLKIVGEVLPQEKNRVELADETDEYGLRIPRITFSYGEEDRKLYQHAIHFMTEALEAAGGKEYLVRGGHSASRRHLPNGHRSERQRNQCRRTLLGHSQSVGLRRLAVSDGCGRQSVIDDPGARLAHRRPHSRDGAARRAVRAPVMDQIEQLPTKAQRVAQSARQPPRPQTLGRRPPGAVASLWPLSAGWRRISADSRRFYGGGTGASAFGPGRPDIVVGFAGSVCPAVRNGRFYSGTRLDHAVTVEDLRAMAHRRLPGFVIEYLEAGGEDEAALARNVAALAEWHFLHRSMVDVSQRDVSTTLFGQKMTIPVAIAPTGFNGLVLAACRSAAGRGGGGESASRLRKAQCRMT